MKHEPKHRSRQSLRGIAVDRFDKIVTDVSIPFASVATFVVGLYSPCNAIRLGSGIVVSLTALMFAGTVFLPRARTTRSPVPDSIVRYLFALVLTCGIVMMFVAMVIFGIGVFIWLRFGEYDRVAFAIQEGTPFLILTIVLWVASFGLLRVRLRGWWLALVGSLGAIAHGIYRYSLFVALVPGNASPVPWFSSNPGGSLTTVLGWIVLVQLTAAFPLFRREVGTLASKPGKPIKGYASGKSLPSGFEAVLAAGSRHGNQRRVALASPRNATGETSSPIFVGWTEIGSCLPFL